MSNRAELGSPERCPTCGSDDKKYARDTCRLQRTNYGRVHPWHESESPAEPSTYTTTADEIFANRTTNYAAPEADSVSAPVGVSAREPHDGWMNSWLFENIKDGDCKPLWSDKVRKLAGDWADFRLAAYRAAHPAPLVTECSNPDCGCHGTLRPGFVCPNVAHPAESTPDDPFSATWKGIAQDNRRALEQAMDEIAKDGARIAELERERDHFGKQNLAWANQCVHLREINQELVTALEAIVSSACDGRTAPEWLHERLRDARAALRHAKAGN